MFIRSLNKNKVRRTCVCGKGEECKKVTNGFHDLGDIRGDYYLVPNPKAGSRKNTDGIDKWVERMCHHLKIDQKHFKNELCYKRSPPPCPTRQSTKKQITKEAYVAHWHFPPQILKEYGKNIPKQIPLEKAVQLEVYHQSGGSFYSNTELFVDSSKQKNVVLIPNYVDQSAIATDMEEAAVLRDADAALYKAQQAASPVKKRAASLVSPTAAASSNNAKRQKQLSSASLVSPTAAVPSNNARRQKQHCSSASLVSPTAAASSNNAKPSFIASDIKRMKKADLQDFVISLQESYEKTTAQLEKELDTTEKTTAQLRKELDTSQMKLEDTTSDLQNNSKELSDLQKAVRAQNDLYKINDPDLREELLQRNEITVRELADLKVSGMNRYSMSHPEHFNLNPEACREYYGFRDFQFLKRFIEKVIGVPYDPPSKLKSIGGHNSENALSEFEQVLIAMFYCNSSFNYYTIGSVFGLKSRVTVRKYIDRWMPVLGEAGDMLSTFTHYLDTDALKWLEPEWYIKLNLRDISAVIDGKDFMCETVRTDRFLNCAQSSNKVNHSAFRLLTWSLPCGAVIQRTPAFFGRASEKAILRAWGSLGRLKFPIGTCILGDKGFDSTAGSYTNYNTTLHPSFLTNGQFSRDQVNHNVLICKKRYTCEVVYSRVASTKKLQGVIARETFKHFESVVGWSHGLANICYGYLQKINNYQH
jgi:hypothetical protein